MANENVKEQLIQATIKLLTEGANPDKITARQIVTQAGVNLAMINYYFNSKNDLLNVAVGIIIKDRAEALKEIYIRPIPPKEKLIVFLTEMTRMSMDYAKILRPAMPYALLEGDMEPQYFILPIIRECYGNSRTEAECRLVALQLISAFQIIFYRSEQFYKYTGININDKEESDRLVQTIVGLYMN